MSFSGGIDLSSLNQPNDPTGANYVIDATEPELEAIFQSSLRHVVVLNVWSARAPGAAAFNADLAKVTNSYAGRILLANIDVDSSPQIAQALQVQQVPMVIGLISGRPVPLFQSTVLEADIRKVFDELVGLATQNGVVGTAAPTNEAEETGSDPRFMEADAALETGDYDHAIAAYEHLLAQNPADAEAAERMAGVKLLKRTANADLATARAAAAENPNDIGAQLLVADLDISGGHVEDAFARLLDLISKTADEDREWVRLHLLELFTVIGNADPRVATARRTLATVLF